MIAGVVSVGGCRHCFKGCVMLYVVFVVDSFLSLSVKWGTLFLL